MVIAKRLGFSMDELNEMDVQSIIDVADVICAGDSKKPKRRKAGKADIDRLLGRA